MDAAVAGGSSGPATMLAVASALLLLVSLAILVLRKQGSSGKAAQKAALEVHVTASGSQEPEPDKPAVRILYGTQTGTAERFSKQLGAELKKRYGESTRIDIIDIENYKAEDRLPKEKLVLFLMATYGDGEPTDNAADFYNWLLAEEEKGSEDLLQVRR